MNEYREHIKNALNRKYEGNFRPFTKASISESPETGTFVEDLEIKSFKEIGLDVLRRGEAALVILSGGLSTRVGSCEPKSIIPLTPVKKKCLLQLHLEKVSNIFKTLGCATHPLVFILTCTFNNTQIKTFLENNLYFGLCSERVILLVQSNLPCFIGDDLEFSRYPSSELRTPKSDIIDFSEKGDFNNFYSRGFRFDSDFDGFVTSPNGNGNIFESLHRSFEFMELLPKLKSLHVIGVDNSLSKPLDPEFIGFSSYMKDVDVLNKCILRKQGENLGVFCVGKFPRIIEYSELDRLSGGCLGEQDFYGNICEHIFSGEFLKKLLENELYNKMPFHAARKRIPFWSQEEGRFMFPEEPNGYKLELFVFDVMEFSSKVMCVLVNREDNFAPLKTLWDHDLSNPKAIQYLMDRQFKKWLSKVNCNIDGICEISPTLSYSGENLEKFKDKVLKGPIYLD